MNYPASVTGPSVLHLDAQCFRSHTRCDEWWMMHTASKTSSKYSRSHQHCCIVSSGKQRCWTLTLILSYFLLARVFLGYNASRTHIITNMWRKCCTYNTRQRTQQSGIIPRAHCTAAVVNARKNSSRWSARDNSTAQKRSASYKVVTSINTMMITTTPTPWCYKIVTDVKAKWELRETPIKITRAVNDHR